MPEAGRLSKSTRATLTIESRDDDKHTALLYVGGHAADNFVVFISIGRRWRGEEAGGVLDLVHDTTK